MPFCTRCGKELSADAKFCSYCGTPTEVSGYSKRYSVYEGELHKCPSCGEAINSFTATCPSCGLELRGAKASNSVTSFVARIENARSREQKISLIRNFPIPNTKEDVWEFMILAATNITGSETSELQKAWYTKFDQSYQKAKMILNENDLRQITVLYDETVRKVRVNNLAQGTKATGRVISDAFSRVFSLSGKLGKKLPTIFRFAMRNILSIIAILAYLKAIQIDSTSGNGVGYELLGGVLSVVSAFMLIRKNVVSVDILFVGFCGGLHFYFANFLFNGAGLQMFGVFTLVLVLIAFIHKMLPSNSNS